MLTAADGADAVSQFRGRSGEVALVISDQSMPVLDGPGAIAAIRETRADVPVIILSGDGEFDAAGANHRKHVQLLTKPVELEALLHAISHAFA